MKYLFLLVQFFVIPVSMYASQHVSYPQITVDREFLVAARRGNFDEMLALLQKNSLGAIANINAQDQYGYTVLMYAARQNRSEVVEQLLLHPQINIFLKDYSEGVTALMIGAAWGYTEIVRLIIEKSVLSADCKDNKGKNALMWAVEWGHFQVAEILNDYTSLFDQDNEGRYVEFYAGSNFAMEMKIKRLLSNDLIDGVKGGFECSSLKSLLDRGANPNFCNEEGFTALMCIAVQELGVDYNPDTIDVIHMFLARGACVDIKNTKDGNRTASDYAREVNNSKFLSVLKNYQFEKGMKQ